MLIFLCKVRTLYVALQIIALHHSIELCFNIYNVLHRISYRIYLLCLVIVYGTSKMDRDRSIAF